MKKGSLLIKFQQHMVRNMAEAWVTRLRSTAMGRSFEIHVYNNEDDQTLISSYYTIG